MGILNFELKMCRKVYKYVNLMHFFFWLTSDLWDRVIFDIRRVVDKACPINDRGSMSSEHLRVLCDSSMTN